MNTWTPFNSGRPLPELLATLRELKSLLMNNTFGNIQLKHLEGLEELIQGFSTEELHLKVPEIEDINLRIQGLNIRITQIQQLIETLKIQTENKPQKIYFHPVTIVILGIAISLFLTLLLILL